MEPGRPAIRFDVTARTLLLALLAVAGAWLLVKLWFVFILVTISLVIAAALHPLVAGLERHSVPRTLALVVIFFWLTAVVVAICVLTIPALVHEVTASVEKLPALQAELARRMQDSRLLAPLAESVQKLKAAELGAVVGAHLIDVGSRMVMFIGESLTVLFLALYILAGREREQAGVFSVVPRRYHLRLARILLNLRTIVGGYVRGQVITSAAMAVFTFVLLTVLGVDNALALAVFAGLTNVIPFVGTVLGAIPVVLASLAKGMPTAIL